ncbi:hypothetical protein ACFE04_015380 [Oxalis oulophora]
MNANQLMQKNYLDYVRRLFMDGTLDGQFCNIQGLNDMETPNFSKELVSVFFDDSEQVLNDLASALNQPNVDFKNLNVLVHKFIGSSCSVGARRITNACIGFRDYSEQQDVSGCMESLQQVKHEFNRVKAKIEALFEMEQQIVEAGGTVPTMGFGF